jgi:hypothetical protein
MNGTGLILSLHQVPNEIMTCACRNIVGQYLYSIFSLQNIFFIFKCTILNFHNVYNFELRSLKQKQHKMEADCMDKPLIKLA